MKTIAIVLAGGRGRRTGDRRPKQYQELLGKPVLCYSLQAFDEESRVDEIILVCGEGEEEYCGREIVARYGFRKVKKIVSGGEERFHSVQKGLRACDGCDYVLIHDSARPLVDGAIIERCLHYAKKYGAAVAAAKASDTVKISDGECFIESTVDRSKVWLMQTPQAFSCGLIRDAYDRLIRDEERLRDAGVRVTDDTMVAKMYGNTDAYLVENPRPNLKITVPDDFILAEALLKKRL